ncbi:glucosidase 2 subunit beta [Trichonephila clavata]|uniref:Glucosidase 2 subunit beta n=1 Tax=Trichonephila clavata TaxID=2740835 RepID=A0A8X6GXE1_TRICU|nr:glucosidase 2 subunit beta [Trichonephila clavata]
MISLFYCTATVEVLRPRGVDLSKKIFYVPDEDFKCIDGSNTIPFNFVNDDFCDCEDGSDEPGTSACSNAFFHCINPGYISLNIPSSRVNDNICDCCDGSDEYNSTADCVNTCVELGKQAREEKQKQLELYEVGYGLWKQYSTQGKQLKENNKIQLENLKKVEIEEEKLIAEKEAVKNEAEELEKTALDAYKSVREEQLKKKEEMEMLQHQEEEQKNAEIAFHELDSDQDNILTYQEIQQFLKFDTNNDGHVSEDEAKFFLHMKDSMVLEEFVTTGWMIMKPIYLLDKTPVTESPGKDMSEKETLENTEVDHEEEDDDDDSFNPNEEDLSDDEEESDKSPVFTPKENFENTKIEPEYDEETQKIVKAANEARNEHKLVVDRLEKVREDIKQFQAFIDADFGSREQFAVLKGQCFDYEDREYTYRFCPFDKASQIAKSGGSDVNLGRWGSWAGPEDNKYSKMRYDNGQLCWNGPSRSTTVLLQCGIENKLLSSIEPNRCEYLFEFSTPAACSMHEDVNPVHQHTEL